MLLPVTPFGRVLLAAWAVLPLICFRLAAVLLLLVTFRPRLVINTWAVVPLVLLGWLPVRIRHAPVRPLVLALPIVTTVFLLESKIVGAPRAAVAADRVVPRALVTTRVGLLRQRFMRPSRINLC